MYLSRVEIDQGNRQKLKDLTHLGAYHSWVENSFPEKFGQDRPRHLWRIDTLRHKRYLLVVSAEKPNLNLLDKYGVPDTTKKKNYDPFLEKVKQNMIYNFRLTANPVHRVTQPGQKNGKLYQNNSVDIYDYKSSSIYDKKKTIEHSKQLLIYAYAMEQEGYKCKK